MRVQPCDKDLKLCLYLQKPSIQNMREERTVLLML